MFIHACIIGTPIGKTQGIPTAQNARLAYMETMSDRIIQALKDVQKNQSELARHVGVQSPSVNDWISGKTKTIKGQNLLRAAEFLGVNPLWLAEGKGPKSAASLKTVRYAIDEFAEDEVTNKKNNLSQELPFYDVGKPAGTLVDELQSRDIPPHIEQAIMALLQTCQKRDKKPQQHAPIFTDEEQKRHI